MNIVLWIIQGVLAVLYVVGAGTKFFQYERFVQQVPSTNALPHALWVAIGVFELLCAGGLTLPAMTGVRPSLVPVAAICLAVEGAAFTWLHGVYGERGAMVFSLVSAALAAFVAYGRIALKPF